MKKILITGCAGFLCSHLTDRLLKDGHKVIGVDSLYSGYKENISNHPNFEFIKSDVCDITPGFFGSKFDYIIHGASVASPPLYQKDPVSTWKSNTIGTYNLLKLAHLHEARFLFISTSEVYGDPLESPQKETLWTHFNPVGIRANYDSSKAAGESITVDFNRQYNVDTKIVRIFNSYGPRLNPNDGRVVSNFIKQALKGEDITVYGNGLQTRSLCYVTDTVDGIIKMLFKNNFIGPVNLGNNHEVTMKELGELVVRLCSSNSKIIYKELPADDPSQRCPNTDLAKKELDWEPKVNLENGLLNTIDWFKRIIK